MRYGGPVRPLQAGTRSAGDPSGGNSSACDHAPILLSGPREAVLGRRHEAVARGSSPGAGGKETRSLVIATMKTPAGRRPLWRCPRCGHKFVTRNLWHSCGRYRLGDHFRGKEPGLRAVFRAWVAAARAAGPVIVYAQKTRIVFQSRVRFGGAVVQSTSLDATLWLKRRVTHPRMHRAENLGSLGYVYHFRLERAEDVDHQLRALVRGAYAVGNPGLRAVIRP